MHQRNNNLAWHHRLSIARPLLAAMIAATVAGCDEYLDRRETVTLGVGDSIAINKATQSIRRWPEASRDAYWPSDGERARIAIERYRSRSVGEEKSGDTFKPADSSSAPK
jgi:hypothetical protein